MTWLDSFQAFPIVLLIRFTASQWSDAVFYNPRRVCSNAAKQTVLIWLLELSARTTWFLQHEELRLLLITPVEAPCYCLLVRFFHFPFGLAWHVHWGGFSQQAWHGGLYNWVLRKHMFFGDDRLNTSLFSPFLSCWFWLKWPAYPESWSKNWLLKT